MRGRTPRAIAVGAVTLGLVTASGLSAAAATNAFQVTNLVSDQPGVAAQVDPNLVNAWGLVSGPSTPWWVADNGSDVSTLYDDSGTPLPLVVKVKGAPTGTVFNGTASFVVSREDQSGAALFLFATESGTIRGWNPAVGTSTPPSTRSFNVVNRASQGAIYKGLAIASTSSGDFLYATDFHNARVDVFDGSFNPVVMSGAFQDPDIPAGFAPFGIQNIGGNILVTYAKQDAAAQDDVHGSGLGFVDMYDTSGNLIGRVASQGPLNAPWGLAMAPADFGKFGSDLLVGNFGNGKIRAYAMTATGTSELAGTLRDTNGDAITIDGLWALEFGNGGAAGPTDSLFFTAGPDDETHGLFGMIEAGS